MFGIYIVGPATVLCDNKALNKNVSIAESTITKNDNSICYHCVCECVAKNILMIMKEGTHYNLSDLLTKVFPAVTRKKICENVMHTWC